MRDQIIYSGRYPTEKEKRVAIMQYCVQTVAGVSWGRIANLLWLMEEHAALDNVREKMKHPKGL